MGAEAPYSFKEVSGGPPYCKLTTRHNIFWYYVMDDIDKFLATSDEDGKEEDWRQKAKILDEQSLRRVSRRFSEELESLNGNHDLHKIYRCKYFYFQPTKVPMMTRRQSPWSEEGANPEAKNVSAKINLQNCNQIEIQDLPGCECSRKVRDCSDYAKKQAAISQCNKENPQVLTADLVAKILTNTLLCTYMSVGISRAACRSIGGPSLTTYLVILS